MRNIEPTLDDFTQAAYANIRLASDEQIRHWCGCNRQSAKDRVERARRKINRNVQTNDKDIKTFIEIGSLFVWKPAFRSLDLFSEFKSIISMSELVKDKAVFFDNSTYIYISLYAISIMHGSTIVLSKDNRARLYAGFSNRSRLLEVKIDIEFNDLEKPLLAPVCLFLTDLSPDSLCDPALLNGMNNYDSRQWSFPIELGPNGNLMRAG